MNDFGIAAGLVYYRAGRKAYKAYPEVRSNILLSFLLSVLVFSAIVAGLLVVLLTGLLAPFEIWVNGYLPNWADWIIRVLVGLFAIVLVLIITFFSLRFTTILLGVFYERCVHPIVARFRPDSVPGHGGPSLIVEILREAGYLVLLLLLQFIPAIGWLLSLAFSLWLVGKGVVAPHKAVLKDRNLPRPAPGVIECISVGSAELALLAIPVIGWFLLPWVMIHMVVGQACRFEESLATQLDPAK